MKKKFILAILFIVNFNCFSLDYEAIKNNIINSFWFKEKKGIESNIKNIYKLNNDFYITYICFKNSQLIYYFDGVNEDWEHPEKSISNVNIKYLTKIGELDAFIGDFTYTESNQVLFIDLHPTMNWNNFVLQGPDFNDIPFFITFPSYQYPSSTLYDDVQKYTGTNKRVNALRYISFNDIRFCIINNKRGFLIDAIGKVYSDGDSYKMDTSKNDSSNQVFFFWSPKEQKYILDETVTQEQIKNAYCPEDYFAYNGLNFSMLDSKLKEGDLKDLDKSQLRVLRNAVYARHGRTFKSVDLQSLWECYTWYKKNPNYSDSLLTDIDKYNIELIQNYEQK